jgi:uncharacterized protein
VKIAVEKIRNGQKLAGEEDILASDWELDSFDVKFVDNIHLDCSFERITNEILVEAKVTTYRDITCSRCLGNAKQKVEQKLHLNYNVNSLGDYLEPNSDIREEVLLNFPMKVLCRQDCKGICPGCKVNLNTEKCKCGNNANKRELKTHERE